MKKCIRSFHRRIRGRKLLDFFDFGNKDQNQISEGGRLERFWLSLASPHFKAKSLYGSGPDCGTLVTKTLLHVTPYLADGLAFTSWFLSARPLGGRPCVRLRFFDVRARESGVRLTCVGVVMFATEVGFGFCCDFTWGYDRDQTSPTSP